MSAPNLYTVTKGRKVRIVSITTITVARMYKRLPDNFPRAGTRHDDLDPINPFWTRGVLKVAQRNGLVGADYAKAVLAQRRRESGERKADGGTSALGFPLSTFRPGPLWRGYGAHVDQHFVRHIETGVRYLKFLPTTDQAGREQLVRLKYFWRDTFPDAAGAIANQASIARWLVPPRQPTPQQTRRPVRWKCITAQNVVEISIAGEVYSFLDAKAWSEADREKRAA